MASRVAALVGPRARAMWVMTFHSACVRILRREAKRLGYPSLFSIYDSADSQRLMALVCRELDLDTKQYPAEGDGRPGLEPEERAGRLRDVRRPGADRAGRALAEAYGEYQRRLLAAGAMDFDDLIMVTVNLFQAFPEVADGSTGAGSGTCWWTSTRTPTTPSTSWSASWSRAAPRCSPAERAGLTAPADRCPPPELCVVGDADQSIYAFRGATIRNILEFEEDYPDATVILLEQNYRSTQNILAAANAVVSPQPGPQAQEPVVRRGRGPADRRLRRGQRARRGRVRRRGGGPADRRGPGHAGRRRGLLPDQRPVPGVRGSLHPGRPALQGGRRGPVLRAARGPGRAGLPAADRQPGGRGVAAPGPQRAQARHRRPRRGVRRRVRRSGSGSPSPRRWPGPAECPGWRPARSTRSQGSTR